MSPSVFSISPDNFYYLNNCYTVCLFPVLGIHEFFFSLRCFIIMISKNEKFPPFFPPNTYTHIYIGRCLPSDLDSILTLINYVSMPAQFSDQSVNFLNYHHTEI